MPSEHPSNSAPAKAAPHSSKEGAPQEGEWLGLLAAWGRFPRLVAEGMRRQGHRVCCLAVRGHAHRSDLEDVVDELHWIGAAQLGRTVRIFRKRGIQRAVMAGKFHKADLYRPWAWLRYIPDREFARTFAPHFWGHAADRKDDTLLGTFVQAYACHGITIVPPTDFAPDLLISAGELAGPPLQSGLQADAQFGWELAREMGRLDIGQSVCIKDRTVIAVEAIEGTDLCIRRAGELCSAGGFTVVKVAKPLQDMRFDVPTVGLRTLESMAKAGAKALVIEAGRTIVLDQEAFIHEANSRGIHVVAWQGPSEQSLNAA